MIRSRRRAHSRVWILLSLLAIAVMTLALLDRRPIVPMDELPGLPANKSTQAGR